MQDPKIAEEKYTKQGCLWTTSTEWNNYFLSLFAGVAILLSITIFATIIGDMLPVSDATPLIG